MQYKVIAQNSIHSFMDFFFQLFHHYSCFINLFIFNRVKPWTRPAIISYIFTISVIIKKQCKTFLTKQPVRELWLFALKTQKDFCKSKILHGFSETLKLLLLLGPCYLLLLILGLPTYAINRCTKTSRK